MRKIWNIITSYTQFAVRIWLWYLGFIVGCFAGIEILAKNLIRCVIPSYRKPLDRVVSDSVKEMYDFGDWIGSK